MDTTIINLFGGPGVGKSTTRASLFASFKLDGIICEEAHEWCKEKVYEENKYVFTDQFYIFAKQRKMLKQLQGKVSYIITDSPILLSAVYDNTNNPLFAPLVISEFNRFNNVNVFLRREKQYVTIGRHQTEEEAREIDRRLESFMMANNISYFDVPGTKDALQLIRTLVGV